MAISSTRLTQVSTCYPKSAYRSLNRTACLRAACAAVVGLLASLLLAALIEGTVWAADDPAAVSPVPPSTGSSPSPVSQPQDAAPSAAPVAQSPPQAVSAVPPEVVVAAPESETKAKPKSDEELEREEDLREEEEEEREEEQEQARGPGALVGDDRAAVAVGGYGGITALGTQLGGKAVGLLGLEAGVLLDNRLSFGLAGFGLVSEINGPDFPDGNESVLGFGYGGVTFRYQVIGRGPVYLGLGALLGGGVITLLERTPEGGLEFNEDSQSANGFAVFEPSLQLHLNLTHWMRLGMDGSYRFVHGVTAYGYEEKNIRGFAGGGHLQFGWF